MFMIVMGAFLMPGGYMMSNLIQNIVANEIDTALLEIKDQGVPLVSDMVKEMGTPEALRGIRDQGVPTVKDILFQTGGAEVLNQIRDQALPIVTEMVKQVGVAEVMNRIRATANPIVVEMVKQVGVAEVLKRIKEQAVPFTETIVNATFLTQVLYSAYLVGEETMSGTGGKCLLNMFFDYQTIDLGLIGGGVTSFSAQLSGAGLPPIQGISQWHGADLTIGTYSLILGLLPSPSPNAILAWGDPANSGTTTPGFMQDNDLGTGILDFLDRVDAAAAGGTSLRNALCSGYGITANTANWNKLVVVANYIRQYWVPVAIPLLVNELQNPSSYVSQQMPQYIGMDTKDIAYAEFLAQWANCSRYPGGMDFHDVVEAIPVGTTGLEVASPSGITLPVALALWDETNPLALTNMDAMETWFEANTSADARQTILNGFPGLTAPQLNLLLNWLWVGSDSFSQYIVPILLESSEGYNMPIATFADQLFMEQWANGTIMGEEMYPGGLDFGTMIEGMPVGTTGFEVGVPVASGMTVDVVTDLWDATDPLSFFNMDGMEGWYATNTTGDPMYETLRTYFGLTTGQMDMIVDWLWDGPDSFSQKMVPILIESDEGYGMPIADFAELLFQEQWANGTIMGEVMYEGGLDFGTMIEGLPVGTTGFEVGMPVASGITGSVAANLWDENNELSLFNMAGMGVWYEANSSDDAYETLQTTFGLTDTQMDMILAWLWDGPDCFNAKLVPTLIASPVGYNMPLDDFALSLLLEQWANGTILGDVMFEGGIDFADIVDLSTPLFGFEVGVPVASGITYASALELFNDANTKSLTNNDGINVWIEAKTSTSVQADLATTFGMTDAQVNMVGAWLWDGPNAFSQKIVPALLALPVESGGRGMSLENMALAILLEQWVNGTADGRSVYPNGFPLPLGDKIIYGFEIGYVDQNTPVEPTGISLASALALWDTTSDTSLTTNDGLAKWWQAVEDPESTVADDLQVAIGLNDKAMGMLLEWLVNFKTNAMPALAQYQLGLPMDTTALCNIIPVFGLVLGAGSLTSGSVWAKKRKTANKTRALDLGKFEAAGKKEKAQKNYIATAGTMAAAVTPAPAQAPVVKAAEPSAMSVTMAKSLQQIETIRAKVADIKAGLSESEQAKIRDAAKAKLAKLSPVPQAPAPAPAPVVVPTVPTPVETPIAVPAPVTAPAPATLHTPVRSAMPTVTELVPQPKLTPDEEEFFQKVMSGMKQVMVKLAKSQYIDPLFISNLLYLLRTRRKKFEQAGNADAMKRVDEMYLKIEQLRDQAKSQQK